MLNWAGYSRNVIQPFDLRRMGTHHKRLCVSRPSGAILAGTASSDPLSAPAGGERMPVDQFTIVKIVEALASFPPPSRTSTVTLLGPAQVLGEVA